MTKPKSLKERLAAKGRPIPESTGSAQVVEKPPRSKKEAAAQKAEATAKGKAAAVAAILGFEEPAKPKKRPGPPAGSGWSQALEDRLVEFLERGAFLETAAAGAGVDVETIRTWLKHGARELARRERGEEPERELDRLVDFRERVSVALVAAENTAAERVTRAGSYDWRASAFYLERRAPQRWGQRIGQLVSEELEAFLDSLEERLPPNVFAEVLRAASDATRGGKAPPARSGEPA